MEASIPPKQVSESLDLVIPNINSGSHLDPLESFVDIDTVDDSIDHFINVGFDDKKMMVRYDSLDDRSLLSHKMSQSAEIPSALTLIGFFKLHITNSCAEDDLVDVL